jgi:lipopolysaccharide transport system permease protein
MSLAQGSEILGALVGRELRIRYKGSALGVLWAVLSPLGFVAILSLLFTRFMPLNIPDYAAFVYSGLLPWTWFDATLHAGCVSLLDNRDLVRKPFFPRAVLPAVVTGSQFALYLLALPVLIALVIAHGRPPRETLLLLPAIWLVEGALAVAFATLLATLGVVIRDVQHLLGMGLMLWFYLTPVFYERGRLAGRGAQWLLWNPMTVVVESHRAVVFEGRAPDWPALAAVAAFAGALLAFSLALFRGLEHLLIEEV